jgi:hypothetical protein
VITKPCALSINVTVPEDPPMPVALIKLIVAVAVTAPAERVPTKRRAAPSKLMIATDLERRCIKGPLVLIGLMGHTALAGASDTADWWITLGAMPRVYPFKTELSAS